MTIPKIIHQIWIGPNPCPINMMNTWKEKHPDFEYILWNEEELRKRNMEFKCQKRINEIEEWCGKADIMRLEILCKYGGIYIDADSICIEPINNLLINYKAFATYENEATRKGLVANGNMAFPKEHQLCKDMINHIYNNKVSNKDTGKRAWMNTGPLLLTNFLNNKTYEDFTILPSYYFLPQHPSGTNYNGHGKVYAYQEWGSTKMNYNIMNNIKLDTIYKEPDFYISILISSYNTNHKFIVECLDSILYQQGLFGMEIVWINDGSDELNTKLLEKTLESFEKKMRFTKIIYKKFEKNIGIGPALHEGIKLCNNEIIMKVDSDDIMKHDRFAKQINFMNSNKDCVLCGSNLTMFKNQDNNMINHGDTNHKELLTWEEYKLIKSHWFTSHPTLCYRKSAILEVGNYNKEKKFEWYACDDFELQLKILKKFGKIYNIKESLIYYRLHNNQITANGNSSQRPEIVKFRNEFIEKMINE
mgnify:FL=1